MKSWIPLGLSFVALVLAGFAALAPSESRAPLPSGTAGDLVRLQGALRDVEDQVLAIEAQVEELKRAAVRPASAAPAPAKGDSAPARSAAAKNPSPGPAGPAAGVAPDLSAVLSSEATLRGYIAEVFETERARRQEEARLRAEERRREWEALREGPYGRFNMKVNSMAKALDLAQNQKDQYHAILVEYADRFKELAKGTNWRDPDSVSAYQEKQRSLQEELDEDVARILTAAQAEAYLKLPRYQRQATGGAVVRSTGSTAVFGGNGQNIEINVGG